MPDLDFAFVDAHIHQWDPRTTPRGVSVLARPLGRWPKLYENIAMRVLPAAIKTFVGDANDVLFPFLPADYARNAGALRVGTVVHVEAGWEDHSLLGPAGETRWLETLDFAATGRRLGAIVGHADLRNPRVGETLDAHMQASPKFRGIRQMASHHAARGIFAWNKAKNLYREPDFLRGFEQLAKRNLRFDAWVYSQQLQDLVELAKRFPEVPIVLDHFGTPVGVGGPVASVGSTEAERAQILARWRDDLGALREHKNVCVKLSGLAMPLLGFGFHRRAAPPSLDELADTFRPFVAHAIDVFGVERAFVASNFPMDKASAPFDRIFGAYIKLAKELGPSAPRALLRENALRFYGIGSTRS